MQFPDPNAGLSGDGPPYNFAGIPYIDQPRGQYRRRGCQRYLGCLVPLLIILLILAGVSFIGNITVSWGPTVIKVGAHPTLIVESQANEHTTIHIHVGDPGGQITLQSPHLFNLPFGFSDAYQKTGDAQTIIYDLPPTVSGIFDFTVPAQTDLKVDSNNASVLIEGVTGQMTVMTISGSLTVRHCNLIGPSLLRSNSGELKALEDHLSGSVALDNNSGSLTYQGSLDPAGSYHFTGNGQPITLTLPLNSAVHIDATTLNSGSITSNIPGVKAENASAGQALHADLGTAPRAQLSLYNNGGNITVNEQGGN